MLAIQGDGNRIGRITQDRNGNSGQSGGGVVARGDREVGTGDRRDRRETTDQKGWRVDYRDNGERWTEESKAMKLVVSTWVSKVPLLRPSS